MMNDIIIHLGAHRTGTTLFQEYLYKNRSRAGANGFDLIGIDMTRRGMLDGLLRSGGNGPNGGSECAERNITKLAQLFSTARSSGRRLILSEENIIGTMEENLQLQEMYPFVRERLSRFRAAFSKADRFYITVRNPSDWWASCILYLIGKGTPAPRDHQIERISASQRGWRQIVEEIMMEYPSTPITFRDFSFKTDNPKRQLIMVSGWKFFEDTKKLSKRSNSRKSSEYLREILLTRGEREAAERILKNGIIFPFNYRQKELLDQKYLRDLGWLSQNRRKGDRVLMDLEAKKELRSNRALTQDAPVSSEASGSLAEH